MSMGRNLRAGLIGLGMMGRHHARNLKALEGVDLVAVADAHGDPHGAAAGLEILPDVEALIAAGIDYAVEIGRHTSELQSRGHLVCRLLLEKKKKSLIETDDTMGGL